MAKGALALALLLLISVNLEADGFQISIPLVSPLCRMESPKVRAHSGIPTRGISWGILPGPRSSSRRRRRGSFTMQGIPDIGTEASSLSSWISQAPAFLMANAHAAHTSAVHEAAPVQLMENPVARALLNTTTGWGVILYSLLLGIGQIYESGKHTLVHNLPKSMRPVVESLVGELSTLGVVGLLLGVLNVHGEESWLTQLSIRFLGEGDLLLEEFEAIHQGLFSVSVTFFVACTLLVINISNQYKIWGEQFRGLLINRIVEEAETGQQEKPATYALEPSTYISTEELATKMMMSDEDMNQEGSVMFELFGKTDAIRTAEFLRFRQRFLALQESQTQSPIPADFKFWAYLERHASNELKDLVKVEPYQLVWVVMLFSISVSFSDFVLSEITDASPAVIAYGLNQLLVFVWAIWNFAKMSLIKSFLLPRNTALYCVRPVKGPTGDSQLQKSEVFPPKYLDASLRANISSHPLNVYSFMELPFAKPATNEHEALFGTVGAYGPKFYMNSMKLVLFTSILITALGVNLITKETGYLPFGFVELIPSVLTILLAPYTFLLYNWVTATEKLSKGEIVRQVLSESNAMRFRTTVLALAKFGKAIDFWTRKASDFESGVQLRRTADDVDREWRQILAAEQPDVILDLRVMFDRQDKDKSGQVDKAEVQELVSELGFDFQDGDLDLFFRNMDTDGSGSVGFKEFCTTVLTSCGGEEILQEQSPLDGSKHVSVWERTFDFFDRDGSGSIEQHEILERLQGMGFDERGVDQLFQDIAGQQKVLSRERFDKYLKNNIEVFATKGRDTL